MFRSERKRLFGFIAFAALLVIGLGGWTWVLSRTLENERRVARAELESNRRKLIDSMALQLEAAIRDAGDKVARAFSAASTAEKGYFAALRLGLVSGITFESESSPIVIPSPHLADWRERPGDLAAAIESGTLRWGFDEHGRDPVASMVAGVLEKTADVKLASLLRQRAMDDTASLRPSFRTFLLGRAGELDYFGKRLLQSENLRAMNGDLQQVEDFKDAEITIVKADGRALRLYWRPVDIAALVKGFPEGMALASGEDAAGYVRRVPGLEQRPFLMFAAQPKWFGNTDRLLTIIGTSSGLLLAGLLVTGVVFGWREARTARFRMDLAASVAHELRTPLAGQRLVLESLANEGENGDKRQDYVGMALRENKRLCRLAEEFLTFSRLERRSSVPGMENVSVSEVLHRAVELMGDALKAADFALEVEDNVVIAGNAEELATVLRNLVENALKYSDGRPWVRVRAKREQKQVVLEVEDRGRGIEKRERALIFRQFHRGDRELARRSDGLGLGLAIVRRIVDAHHGSIQVFSEPGRGSTFKLVFPQAS